MNPRRWPAMLVGMALAAIVPAAGAQQGQPPVPHVGYVYPAGARQGSAVEVQIGGQFLDGVNGAHVSGAGVKASVVEYVKPLTPVQFNLLREKLSQLEDKRTAAAGIVVRGTTRPSTRAVWTAEDQKMLAEIRQKLATFVRRPSSPAIAETVRIKLTLAADAAPGRRELRLLTPAGLTNPLVFHVDQLPEFSKKTAAAMDVRNPNATRAGASSVEMKISLPAVANGQIMPGDVDRYRFQASKGQRLVIAVSARELMPYMADAVPGWFSAAVTLCDGSGRELAYAGNYRFHPDPVLCYQVVEDGQYVIRINDALYRGREDFVYRISVGELPFVTSIFPLGGPAGTDTVIEVKGWNLPVARLAAGAAEKTAGIVPLSVRKGALVSNSVPFAVDVLPECIEREPNDSLATAQRVTPPIFINGRIEKSGDWDVFRFDGRAGEEIVAEVWARRLDSPLDSVLRLTDPAGKQLAFNDDHEDKGLGLSTHHADSLIRAKLPATGAYFIHVGDVQRSGGPEYGYRLRISAPMPDFALRVSPSGIHVRPGATAAFTVHAVRKDGFSGEIALSLKGAPAGFSLSGARIPANQDQVRLTLTAPQVPMPQPVSLSLEGRATVDGRAGIRPAQASDEMMQAFAYRHLVPAEGLMVSISGQFLPRAALRVAGTGAVKIPAGGTARVQVYWPPRAFMSGISLELSDPPDGITIRSVTPIRQGMEVLFGADAAKVKPGLQGNLILNATADRPAMAAGGQANRRRAPVGTAPAIPFEIVAR